MKMNYYHIIDRESKRFYTGSDYLPWIIWAFTDEPRFAKRYTDLAFAKSECKRFMQEKTAFDGNSPLEKGRLGVVQITFTEV